MSCVAPVLRTSVVSPRCIATISRLLAGLVCAVVFAPASADEIYRWVDEHGRVHFGDQPPESAERVELAPAPAGDPQLQLRRERGELLLDVMEEDRRRRNAEQRADAQADADRRSKCETARRRASQAADANFIVRPTGDPDSPHYLDEAERQQFEQRIQAEIRRYCGGAEAPE